MCQFEECDAKDSREPYSSKLDVIFFFNPTTALETIITGHVQHDIEN